MLKVRRIVNEKLEYILKFVDIWFLDNADINRALLAGKRCVRLNLLGTFSTALTFALSCRWP